MLRARWSTRPHRPAVHGFCLHVVAPRTATTPRRPGVAPGRASAAGRCSPTRSTSTICSPGSAARWRKCAQPRPHASTRLRRRTARSPSAARSMVGWCRMNVSLGVGNRIEPIGVVLRACHHRVVDVAVRPGAGPVVVRLQPAMAEAAERGSPTWPPPSRCSPGSSRASWMRCARPAVPDHPRRCTGITRVGHGVVPQCTHRFGGSTAATGRSPRPRALAPCRSRLTRRLVWVRAPLRSDAASRASMAAANAASNASSDSVRTASMPMPAVSATQSASGCRCRASTVPPARPRPPHKHQLDVQDGVAGVGEDDRGDVELLAPGSTALARCTSHHRRRAGTTLRSG